MMLAFHSISKAGYVTSVLAIVRTELRAREPSSFCDFWKITCCDFTLFILFDSSKRKMFKMCLVRSIVANLCPIMIHFHVLDLMCVALKKWELSFDAQCMIFDKFIYNIIEFMLLREKERQREREKHIERGGGGGEGESESESECKTLRFHWNS